MAVRRRVRRDRRVLTGDERSYLRWGHGLGFAYHDADGVWNYDLEAAREAWEKHRDELIADAARMDCIPWAAREFEGAEGRVSPYDHLRAVLPKEPA